jgi:hypothetical protein
LGDDATTNHSLAKFFMYMNNFVHDEIVGKRANNMM